MNLPVRLKTIADLIKDNSNVADVGADHGLLEQFIALERPNVHILAIENKKGPFNNLNSLTAFKNVEISCSDGISRITDDYDTLVIAGMGGKNIISILDKNPKKLASIERIIIDAHTFIPEARQGIIKYGFDIESEKIVYEGSIYYLIISFIRNNKIRNYTKDEIDFGVYLSKDPLFEEYKKSELNSLKHLLSDLEGKKECESKFNEIKDTIRRLKAYGQN